MWVLSVLLCFVLFCDINQEFDKNLLNKIVFISFNKIPGLIHLTLYILMSKHKSRYSCSLTTDRFTSREPITDWKYPTLEMLGKMARKLNALTASLAPSPSWCWEGNRAQHCENKILLTSDWAGWSAFKIQSIVSIICLIKSKTPLSTILWGWMNGVKRRRKRKSMRIRVSFIGGEVPRGSAF